MKYKIGASICLLVQIGLMVLGVAILQGNPTSDFVKYTWYALIPINAIFGIVNIKTILS